jgi:YggT family protein
MLVVLDILSIVLQLYWWVLLIMIILSWLISFNVINTRNQFVSTVWTVVNQLTEPILRPIRRFMPNFSGLDLSPLIAFLIIFALQSLMGNYLYPFARQSGL